MGAVRTTQRLLIDRVLNNLNLQQRRILALQEQLATGQLVNRPSDDSLATRRAISARTEVTKKVWDYIKKLDLQDPANRRMINADDKLKAVFGGKAQVSMFEMTKLISDHLK